MNILKTPDIAGSKDLGIDAGLEVSKWKWMLDLTSTSCIQHLNRHPSPYPYFQLPNWRGLDSDNGSEFINHPLNDFCRDNEIIFTRSRENKKNDNAYVEQKNWTHVRKILGYFRYNTTAEQTIINSLYRNELRLYKIFFQPIMKLSKKVRLGAKRHRKYEPAMTPFKRLLESDQIEEATTKQLIELHEQLNPAALKRAIEKKILLLYRAYQPKRKVRSQLSPGKEVVYG